MWYACLPTMGYVGEPDSRRRGVRRAGVSVVRRTMHGRPLMEPAVDSVQTIGPTTSGTPDTLCAVGEQGNRGPVNTMAAASVPACQPSLVWPAFVHSRQPRGALAPTPSRAIKTPFLGTLSGTYPSIPKPCTLNDPINCTNTLPGAYL
jgi:hypothetical protein